MTIDKRQSVRVTSKVLFACNLVSAEKFKQIAGDYNNGITLYNREELADVQVFVGAQSSLAKLKEKDEDLANYLMHIDNKINQLLKKIDNSPSILDDLVLQKVNIGANGLAFWTDEKIEEGAIVEAYIVLQPGHIFINCFGTVVECVEGAGQKGEGSRKCRISVNFTLITDEDREQLIHYNFKQQSLALKQRRLGKQNAE